MTTNTMTAAVLYATGEPLRIVEDIQIPPLAAGQVQVKIFYSGLCHSQLMEVRGHRGDDPWVPHLLGHEGVGEVVAIGEGVTKVAVGDTVVLGWIRGQGADVPGAKYPHQDHVINSGGVTTFSTQTIAAENRLVKLPTGMPHQLAVLLGCALPTGLGLVYNEARLQTGKTVAVFGLGGIGLSALIAASSCSPTRLIAVDVEPQKLALAKELGATDVINSAEEDAVARIRELCPGGVDNSFEAAGTCRSIEQAFEAVRDGGGLCVFASHPQEGESIQLEPHAFHRGKQIRGSWGGGSDPDRDIPHYANLYLEGRLKNLEKLLSHEYKLSEINQALDDLEQRKITRALISLAD